ncbi:MAG: recombinase family protein [Chitinophagaceae bacterium]|nr:recombinase family protein [Chitinophagaceae bacterium]
MGLYHGETQSEVRHKLKKEGFYFSESTFSAMIRNRVYMGHIFVTGNTKDEGYYVQGLHAPLITAELFEKVQNIIASNSRAKKKVDAKSFKEELALRGLLACDNCGNNLTGSTSTSKSGKSIIITIAIIVEWSG